MKRKSVIVSLMAAMAGGLSLFAVDVVYVDNVNGNDASSGLTREEAKKTIDAAYSIVSSHDAKIVLLPGTHPSPSGAFSTKGYAPAYRVRITGDEGPDSTVLDGGGERCFTGCPETFTSVEGCTLTNFHCQNVNWQMFYFISFSNCVFSGDFSRATSDRRILFYGCRFQDCRADMSLTYGYEYDDTGSGNYYGNGTETFYGCAVFDSIFRISSGTKPHRFDCCSYFENCFLDLGPITRLSAIGTANVLGRPQRFIDTTMLVAGATDLSSGGFSNCLLGFEDGTDISGLRQTTPCIVTGRSDLADKLGSDRKPTVQEWRTYGYDAEDSETVIALKASISAATPGNALSNVSDRVSFAAYREWAVNVKDASGTVTADIASVNASPNSYLAYAIDSPTLITNDVKATDAEIRSFKADPQSGGFSFELGVKNAVIGEDALAENLADVFRIEGSPSLSGQSFSQDNVEFEFGEMVNGKVQVSIRPKTPSPSSYFFRAGLTVE